MTEQEATQQPPVEGQAAAPAAQEPAAPVAPAAQEGVEGDALFTPDEMANATPEMQKRIDGMVKSYHRRMSELDRQRKESAALADLLRERVNAETVVEEPQGVTIPDGASAPRSGGPPKTKFETILEAMEARGDAAADVLRAMHEDILSRANQAIGSVSQRVTLDTEFNRCKGKYTDFEKVLTPALADEIHKRTGVTSLEAAYKIAKADLIEKELSQTRQALAQLQQRAGTAARTERPGGPASSSLTTRRIDAMTPEERRKLSWVELVALSEEENNSRS